MLAERVEQSSWFQTALKAFLAVAALATLFAIACKDYLLFHTLVETGGVIVGCLVFAIFWNTRRLMTNGALLFLGIACLFAAIFAFVHVVTYVGMGLFPTFDSNPSLQAKTAERWLIAMSFAAAPLFIRRRVHAGWVLAGYSIVSAFVLASIFVWPLFPTCTIGSQTTLFERASRMIACVLYCVAAYLLSRQQQQFSPGVLRLLLASLVAGLFTEGLTVAAFELRGTLKITTHLLQLISVALLYQAFVAEGLTRPYSLIFKELKASEERFRQLFEQFPDTVILADTKGTILDANPAAEQLLNRKREQIIGLNFSQFQTPGHELEYERLFQESLTQPRGHCAEQILLQADGSEVSVEVHARPLDLLGQVVLLAVFRDVTERQRLESELAQARKLESLGHLAAGIAHEINTPTQYIGDNITFLREGWNCLQPMLELLAHPAPASDGDHLQTWRDTVQNAAHAADLDYLLAEVPHAVSEALEGVQKVARIVRALKEFSHPGSQEKQAFDINRCVENTLTISRNEWKDVAQLVTDLDPALPLVAGHPGDINQVLLNLVVNAAHAIATATNHGANGLGTISVSTRHKDEGVEIRVADTGTGIEKAHWPKLFAPFFTTKEVGRGTGQGLAIAHNIIVNKHGGQITFETEVGHGTTFIVRLPLNRTAAASAEGSPLPVPPLAPADVATPATSCPAQA